MPSHPGAAASVIHNRPNATCSTLVDGSRAAGGDLAVPSRILYAAAAHSVKTRAVPGAIFGRTWIAGGGCTCCGGDGFWRRALPSGLCAVRRDAMNSTSLRATAAGLRARTPLPNVPVKRDTSTGAALTLSGWEFSHAQSGIGHRARHIAPHDTHDTVNSSTATRTHAPP